MDYTDELKAVPARELEPGDEVINFDGLVRLVHEAGTRSVYVEFSGATEDQVYGAIWSGDREIVRRARPNEREGA